MGRQQLETPEKILVVDGEAQIAVDLREKGKSMCEKWTGYRKVALLCCVIAVAALVAVVAASCGSGGSTAKQTTGTGAVKGPPGVDLSQAAASSAVDQSSANQSSAANTSSSGSAAASGTTQAAAKTPGATGDLVGAHVTVVNATRPTTNKSVISSSAREVKGDYLEVELTIDNTGDGLLDLSQYSWRLKSPGIAADTYADYYGDTGTYGKYVTTNEISASLLNYSDLQPVAYKVKSGEQISKVFLFFDLNPNSIAKNDGVTKDNTSLVVHKSSGTDYGSEVAIPLTGYPD